MWMHGHLCPRAGRDQRGETGPSLLMVSFTGMAAGPAVYPEGLRTAHHCRPLLALPEVPLSAAPGSGLCHRERVSLRAQNRAPWCGRCGPSAHLGEEGGGSGATLLGVSAGCKSESLWEMPGAR